MTKTRTTDKEADEKDTQRRGDHLTVRGDHLTVILRFTTVSRVVPLPPVRNPII